MTVFRETVQSICDNASNIGPEADPVGWTAYPTEGGVVWLIQKVGVQEAADGGRRLRLEFIEIQADKYNLKTTYTTGPGESHLSEHDHW